MVTTRGAGTTLMAELAKPTFFPIYLVFIDWPSDPVYAHTNTGDVSWNSQTWTGVGRFGQLALPTENQGMAARHATFGLVGLTSALNAKMEDADRDMQCSIYFGCVTARAGNTLVGDPVEIFSGLADDFKGSIAKAETGTTHGASLMARSGPSQRAFGVLKHTNEQHQVDNPGDTLFRHAAGTLNAYRKGFVAPS